VIHRILQISGTGVLIASVLLSARHRRRRGSSPYTGQ
jgi:hypothetical protein